MSASPSATQGSPLATRASIRASSPSASRRETPRYSRSPAASWSAANESGDQPSRATRMSPSFSARSASSGSAGQPLPR